MGTLAGTVKDSGGNPAARLVRAYVRDTGQFVAQALSDPSTGAFSITTTDGNAHFVVCHGGEVTVDTMFGSVVFLLSLPSSGSVTEFSDAKGKSIVAVGSCYSTTSVKKYGNGSIYLNGASYLKCNDIAVALAGASEFCLDGWFCMESLMSGQNSLFGFHTSSGGNRLVVSDSYLFGATMSDVALSSTLTYSSLGTFVHVALERYNGVTSVYKNGNVVGSSSTVETIANTDLFSIGQEYDAGPVASDFYKGWVNDRFRVTRGARFKGAFSVPTSKAMGALFYGTEDSNAKIFDNIIPA